MTSVCTGSLVYAAAGLLAGRPATTHWTALELLAWLDPAIDVQPDARYVDDGDVVTSAGVSVESTWRCPWSTGWADWTGLARRPATSSTKAVGNERHG